MKSTAILILFFPALLLLGACGRGHSSTGIRGSQECLGALLDSFDGDTVYLEHLPEMPDDGCAPLRSRRFAASFHKMFNDSNRIQLLAADSTGISPIHTLADIWNMRRPVVRLNSCEDFFVDTLRYSYPYLVPEAAALAHDIGRAFNDSLRARGGGQYRMRLSSLLRTGASVRRLRRVNRNAVDTSAHQFATTFDIAYNKFICDATNHPRTAVDLKNLLAEIIDDMRRAGRCYVKYEYRQGCFHITVRPDGVAPRNTDKPI